VAGAKIDVSLSEKIDVASGVWTHGVECLHLVARPAKINRADGDLSEFIPGIDAIGEDWEFAGYTVVGKSFEPGDMNRRTGGRLPTERIQ
jgi:hypothetical protein